MTSGKEGESWLEGCFFPRVEGVGKRVNGEDATSRWGRDC